MGFGDVANYVLFDNPVSRYTTQLVKGTGQPPQLPSVTIITEKSPLWQLASEMGPFVRIAAVMGASAVALGAYGAHRSYPLDKEQKLRAVAETANRMHFYHSLALFGVPMCKNPKVAGTLLITGTILFSGTCYYHAFTGENKLAKLAPIGGTILIIGWLSMFL